MVKKHSIKVATRSSNLAIHQANQVKRAVEAVNADISVDLVTLVSSGDLMHEKPIRAIGSQGVFAKEIQTAVLTGRADIAVHSAKDLPTVPVGDLEIVAVLKRGEVRDALVGCTIADLHDGSIVATGSPRRRAQLSFIHPGLVFSELRGNIESRLRRSAEVDAVVVAAVALERLGLEAYVTDLLSTEAMLPQVGQGAIAVECREGDLWIKEILAQIDDYPSRLAVQAERSFMFTIGQASGHGGACNLPIAALAQVNQRGLWVMRGMLASEDGLVMLKEEASGTDPMVLADIVADHILTSDEVSRVFESL